MRKTILIVSTIAFLATILCAWYLYAPKNQQAPVMVKTNVTMKYEYPITGVTPLTSARRSVYLTPGNITISIDVTKPLSIGGYLPLVLQNARAMETPNRGTHTDPHG